MNSYCHHTVKCAVTRVLSFLECHCLGVPKNVVQIALARVVKRAGAADATLSALSLSRVTLAQAFVSGKTAYTASVGHGVTETTVNATASDANASVEITPEDADDETPGDQVNLAVGETTITTNESQVKQFLHILLGYGTKVGVPALVSSLT